ncbi:MAG TPA: lysophospholipid acyltransferase family protein [Thermoanaerobaculia bacterium]|nr:lysophospholipid acyltransferase family protein [Thermoanaerobaculia bacterium]
MRSLRAAAVWTAVGLLTVAFGLPSIVAAFVPPRGDWFLRFARGWARSILRIAGISVAVLHPERLARGRGYVVAANHESFCDIVVLLSCLPFQVRFLAKRSIFRVPVLGWSIAAAGFIPVDRGERASGPATLDAALARLAGGRSVVIFPEETRTRTGELLPFKKGAARLALRSGLPLLPLGLSGTRRILPPGSLYMSPGRVVVCVGEEIPCGGVGAKARSDVTRDLREEVARLRQEAAAAAEARS